MLSRLLAGSLAFLTLSGAAPAADDPAAAPSVWAELGRGINLGNALEASPKEGAWGVTLHAEYFQAIAQAGFKTVRLPVAWSLHMGMTPPYAIDPIFLARVDWAVEQAGRNGLHIVINDHNDNPLCADPEGQQERFVALWKQLGEHYKGAPPSVLFELCNEPAKKLDAAHWNTVFPAALAAVRATNPDRWVVVGPVNWNNIGFLPQLVLPENDRRLLVTVHFYDPFHFTHQGASWVDGSKAWLGTRWTGTAADKQGVSDQLEKAAAWGRDHARPIFVGEFGAFSTGPIDDRAAWTSYVARTCEEKGMAWAYWEFCSGFGIYDPKAKTWREPLLKALRPVKWESGFIRNE